MEATDISTISISVENQLSDQRLEYPADTGLAYIAWTMDWNGAWGTTSLAAVGALKHDRSLR